MENDKNNDGDKINIRKKRLTVHDVAQHAGVSTGTVSRVINDVPGVGADVARRVQTAIEELGWQPNIAAQNIRSSASRMIGFIFSDIRNPLYATMTKGAEEVFGPRGYLLVSSSSDGRMEREVDLIDLYRRRRADGLILSITDESNQEVRTAISRSGISFVMLERSLDGEATSISADHYGGTLQAVEHLMEMGHRRIAMITGGRGTLVMRERLRALEDGMASGKLDVDPDLLRLDSFDAEYGYHQVQMLMGKKNPPTAMLCLGVRLLPGVVSGLQSMGKTFPGDISLICSNDTETARILTPPITAIRYDAHMLGKMAADSLLDQISRTDGKLEVKKFEIPTELVLRDSVRRI
ncbi:MAG: substrate-binding domain-containing protein [Roseovarius sp.]|jgi:LacI family transcriptional regulator|uniref:LacI family DNA-binding transcriptional regulator n=1 Tax=Roseovarius sp. TaxID=1486281 RepID=UPI0032EE8382